MNKTTILGCLVGVVIGLAGGYVLAAISSAPVVHDMNSVMARMTDGLEEKEGAEFEQAFIDEMILHHEGAVAMAQMVLLKTDRPELVQLANEIISAQTREIEMMREWSVLWFGGQAPANSVEREGEAHDSDH